MNLTCLHCGKSFVGQVEKFCSKNCQNAHIADINRRTEKAVREDSGHTDKMSQDE